MNRVSSSFVKSLFVAALAVSGLACAAPVQPVAAKADPAKGGTLFESGDAARGVPACVSCHGASGNSTIAGIGSSGAKFAKASGLRKLAKYSPSVRSPRAIS